MDIISAYREVGSYRGAAAISGTTAKTVKRVIARHESGGAPLARRLRKRNYDAVTELVAERRPRARMALCPPISRGPPAVPQSQLLVENPLG